MPNETQSPTFTGDISAQTLVRAESSSGSLVLTLDESLAAQLGPTGEDLAAATVSLGDGKVLLLVAKAEQRPVHIRRLKSNHIAVCSTAEDATAADNGDLVVDEVSEAFLILKQSLYERGELELSEPLSADDILAFGAENFEALKRLLDK